MGDVAGTEPGFVDIPCAEVGHFRAPGEPDGHVRAEEVAKTSGFGVKATEIENSVPRPARAEVSEEAEKRWRAFAEQVEFFDERIVARDVRASVMCHGFDMNAREGVVERTEGRRVEERVAEACGGEH